MCIDTTSNKMAGNGDIGRASDTMTTTTMPWTTQRPQCLLTMTVGDNDQDQQPTTTNNDIDSKTTPTVTTTTPQHDDRRWRRPNYNTSNSNGQGNSGDQREASGNDATTINHDDWANAH
ncbi:hypothetical protein EDB89DRAFT_1907931 [Lactarius sanguifluus]|nr:hypothetical protein EDB89DRAFT_1907931 [Lactarius sanguifluus]